MICKWGSCLLYGYELHRRRRYSWNSWQKQERQCTYKSERVPVPIVAVEKQYALHIQIVCSLGTQHAKPMPRIVAICGLCFLDTDTQWRSWLRHCATSRKLGGSIPDGAIGIFHWQSLSGRTMALCSTQPLTEMSTRIIFFGGGGKGGPSERLTNLPLSSADCHEIWEPQTLGTLSACPGIVLPF